MKHWESLHRLKRNEVTASNGEPLTKCSFRDQGKGGWRGGGSSSSHPALASQQSSTLAGEPTAFLSLHLEYLGTQSCANLEQHQAHKATWSAALALPWLKTDLQDAGATCFLGLLKYLHLHKYHLLGKSPHLFSDLCC